MSNATDFRDLIVWQKGIALAKTIYTLTSQFPNSERFGLTSQIRRSAVSIPSNIAEGNARQSRQDYIRFLIIARGSIAELETQLIIARELQMLPKADRVWDQIREVARILQALINKLRARDT